MSRTDRWASEPEVAKRARFDVGLLTGLVVVLFGIPSILVFAPLGGAGTPAQMLGVVLLVLWVTRRMRQSRVSAEDGGLIRVAAIYLLAVLVSYLAAATRPIPPIEVSAADRGLVSTMAWIGMLLFACAGLRSSTELDILMRRICLAGGLLAGLGLLQFVTKQPFTNYIQIPGLSSSHDLESVTSRADLVRPAGTAIHPIEFGAVLTMILPIALHYAIMDRHRRLLARWAPVAAISAAVPISISRSAIISAAVALLVLIPTWPVKLRRRSYVALVVLGCGFFVLVPGLLGTLRSLFTGISNDTSAQSRTDSYSLAAEFILRAPLFGRGFRTFLPSYRILDNQYLLSAIETGIVGVVAFLALLGTSVRITLRVRRGSSDARTRSLAQSLAASIGAAACSFALYDALSFPMAASLLFLLIGCVGALHRTSAHRVPRGLSS